MVFKLLFTILPFLLLLEMEWSWVRKLAAGKRARACWRAFLLVCGSKFLAFGLLGGDAFAPELPEKAIWLWNWLYSGLVILFGLALATRLVAAAFRVPPSRLARIRRFALPAVAWGLSAWGVWSGVRVPDVVETEIGFECLPPELDGYRIVQLTDLHASSAAEAWRTRAIVERANALDADLVCLTGDYADCPSSRSDRLEPLVGLKAKDGVWAVTGNHEYYRDREGWREWFARKGFRFLENECAFPRPNLALGGVPDETAETFGETPPDPAVAFASATNGEFRILLSHRPLRARENFAATRFNLQLSGHTHGGIMPILSWLVTRHNNGYVRGKYEFSWRDHTLYVSPGCGQWAGFPVRFFDPAEITVVTLRRERGEKPEKGVR